MKDKTNIGLYVHIPFCKSKCPYCDFYSVRLSDADDYTMCVLESMEEWSHIGRKADTLYFGGGTPSLLGGKNIAMVTRRARELYGVDGEITVECNPSAVEEDFFNKIADAGVNRISLGMQSAVDSERRSLGRTADSVLVAQRIEEARQAGIKNISLDLMLGVPNQTEETLRHSVNFCVEHDVEHISAYMLKLEEGTYYYNNADRLSLPDEDATADMYLLLSELLREKGYNHYEISNFAKSGFEGKHNLKYWNCEEYLGIGPSAHSFIDGRRFYYPRDLTSFKLGNEPVQDGNGGDENEYMMLRLRLSDGIKFSEYFDRFGKDISPNVIKKARLFQPNGYMRVTDDGFSLTTQGFLLSNTIISELNCEQ